MNLDLSHDWKTGYCLRDGTEVQILDFDEAMPPHVIRIRIMSRDGKWLSGARYASGRVRNDSNSPHDIIVKQERSK